MKEVVIYTDGSCLGNPGRGGYGAILVYGDVRREISEGFLRTTNNRMELLSVIKALSLLKEPCSVLVYSDSQYVVNSVEKGWLSSWAKKNWVRKSGIVPNADLWKLLLPLLSTHKVSFNWVRGHADNPDNNRCDELARAAAGGDNLSPDTGYTGS
ncbi:ribonuclease H [Clostridia bacterium]|nr:ribonuclease H [Clostridia bacterium]